MAARSAKDVWLVGFAYRSSVDDGMGSWHWNGKRWVGVGVKKLTATVSPVFSVASSGRDAWAVGRTATGALALHWNQRFRDHLGYTWWARVPVPRAFGRAGLNSVAMISRHDVWAVGDGIVLRWRGSWSRVAAPTFVNSWTGIAVTRVGLTSGVWITGYDQDLDQWRAARWTGSGWSASTVATGLIHPRPGLNIAASSSSDAWIVGRSPENDGRALVVHWDGTNWSPVAGLPLPPSVSSELRASSREPQARLGSGLVSLVGRAAFARPALERSALVTSGRAGNRVERDCDRPRKSAGLGCRRKLSRQTARARQRPSLPLLSLRAAAVAHAAAAPKSGRTLCRESGHFAGLLGILPGP